MFLSDIRNLIFACLTEMLVERKAVDQLSEARKSWYFGSCIV